MAQHLPDSLCAFFGGALVSLLICSLVFFPSCDEVNAPDERPPQTSEYLSPSEIRLLLGRAVNQAHAFGENITAVVADRDGNILGLCRMVGTTGTDDISIRKARTASFLSSNQHAFTTLTACFITRNHFPPGIANTPAGPLFGVGFSSLLNGDIQPNGNALNADPGGVPIYKNGQLVGGIGITGSEAGFTPLTCSGSPKNEVIALSAATGEFAPLPGKRGDNQLIDGIRFLYSNSPSLPSADTLNFTSLVDTLFVIAASPPTRFPYEGEVNLDASHNFQIRGSVLPGNVLTVDDVTRIIHQAATQAARTRAAIRLPVGVAAQVFISVVDKDGFTVLGVWRTSDATIFSYDVSVQKARTALAFSDPNNSGFGDRIRRILGLPLSAGLAMTTRAVGFLSQDFFPPGIDRDSLGNPVSPGPLFEGPNFEYQQRIGLMPFGNGITIFPGGIPLYKNGQIVGAIGISGDGVDQDDLICFSGAAGFEPPPNIRCDQFFYGGVRLPYVKFPRQPER